MKVILATGMEKLEETIKEQLSGTETEVVEQVYYKEGVYQIAVENNAEVVILAATLPGDIDMNEIISMLRMEDIRIVLLPDSTELAEKALTLGVYDIIMGEIDAQKIVELLFNPSTFKQAVNKIKGGSKREKDILQNTAYSFKKNISWERNQQSHEIKNESKKSIFKKQIFNFNKFSNLLKKKEKKEKAKAKDEKSSVKQQVNIQTEPYQTKVLLVVGAARRVGATSFALALAGMLSRKYEVRVLDAGGGATRWLTDHNKFECSPMPPASIVPGVVSIVDAGVEIPEGVQPLTERMFVVTDMSREAVNLKKFSMSPNVHIVGNRGAPEEELRSLAMLWNMEVFCNLPEDPGVKKAEMKGVAPAPKSWFKQLKKIL